MMMNVEQSVEWKLAEETEVLGGNLPQCHFVDHKSPMTWARIESRAAAVGSRPTRRIVSVVWVAEKAGNF
jgi:hypothetical protein